MENGKGEKRRNDRSNGQTSPEKATPPSQYEYSFDLLRYKLYLRRIGSSLAV